MKNTIPLIIAVLLGLAAVFAVNRHLARNAGEEVEKIPVLVANKDLDSGVVVRDDDIAERLIPRTAFIGHQHVRAEERYRVAGQTLARGIGRGGFILLDDVMSPGTGLAEEAAKGEWTVPVHFADSTLVQSLQQDDEIAIVMIAQDSRPTGRHTQEGRDEEVRTQTARVLFPMVRVLRKTSDGILVSLPPQEAQRLLMAQLNAPLYPMLRQRGDFTHRSVMAGAGVTSESLSEAALVARDKTPAP